MLMPNPKAERRADSGRIIVGGPLVARMSKVRQEAFHRGKKGGGERAFEFPRLSARSGGRVKMHHVLHLHEPGRREKTKWLRRR